MSIQYYPNGIGGSPPGDFLDTCKPLQTSGNVWYVSWLTGTDAVSPAGQNREKPLKTVAQAVTNALSGDIVVFLPGHTETLLAPQVVAKQLTLLGEGTTAGSPAVSFVAGSATDLFNISSSNVEVRNIFFPESLVVNNGTKLYVAGTRCRLIGCRLEQGAKDTGPGISLNVGSDQPRIESCTVISTATSSAAQPKVGIQAASGATVADLEIADTVVSAGPFGFSNFAAVDLANGGAVFTRLKMTGLSLLLGADMALGASATGHVNIQTATGGSRVSWG